MSSLGKKCLLAGMLLCLVPATFAAKPKERRCEPARARKCQAVPEGGSGLVYLLGAGVTCAGAMLIRSRSARAANS